MATTEFIESLHIEDNVFELKENTVLDYLVHYAAPYTGDGEISVPSGVKFAAHGPMNDHALYMHPIGEENALLSKMEEKEKAEIPELAARLAGFSFYIKEEEVERLPLEFVCGSRERLLEIFKLLREEQSKPVVYKKTEDVSVKQENNQSIDIVDDLPF